MSPLEIFEILDTPERQDWVLRKEHQRYEPFLQSALENSDVIRIAANANDQILHLAESYILIRGKVQTANGTGNPGSTVIPGFVGYLFEEIRISAGGREVDKTRYPGLWSAVRNNVVPTFAEHRALHQASVGDAKTNVVKDHEFAVKVPLKMFSGLAQDYRKIFCNLPLELTLVRSRNDKNVLLSPAASVTDVVKLTELSWFVPHFVLTDEGKLAVLKLMQRDATIHVPFRRIEVYEQACAENHKDSWHVMTTSLLERPRFVIVAFQTGKHDDQTKDNSKFDTANINNLRLFINNQPHSNIPLDCEWKKRQCLMAYYEYCELHRNYFGNTNMVEPVLSYGEFLSNPIFCFDTSRAHEVLATAGGACDLRIEYETAEGEKIPAGTIAYVFAGKEKGFFYNVVSGDVRPAIVV